MQTQEATVNPYAQSRNISPIPYTKKQLEEAVSFMKSKKNTNILVCWAHQQLPDMARMLGVPADKVPEHWTGKRFDVTWVIRPGEPPSLTQYPQRLLYGDVDDVIPLVKQPKKHKH